MAAGICGLDHWAIMTRDQDRCVAFYQDILGLKVGPRPKLSFDGIWLYAGGVPIVHVMSNRPFEQGSTGAFDHVAFSMDGTPEEMEQRLHDHNVQFSARLIERTGTYQIACRDPDGCGVELNFQNVALSTLKSI